MQRSLQRLSVERAEELFKFLHDEAIKFKSSTNVANLPLNRDLNRWHNVLPADSSRVILNPTFKSSDYINANHVVVPEAERAYILTQGPTDLTIGHFWNMVWQQNTSAIVMLCKTVERGICKCAHYWPRNSSPIMGTSAEPLKYDQLEIKLLDTTENSVADTRIRTMELTEGEDKRIVTQYHFMIWPDFGVPETTRSFLELLKLVGTSHPSTNKAPNVVHCSAGIGRSGTYCLVDSCFQKMRNSGEAVTEKEVLDILLEMRQQRDGLVQTSDQLRFAFAAIADAIGEIDSEPANLIHVEEANGAKSRTPSPDVKNGSLPKTNGFSGENGEKASANNSLSRKRSTDFGSSEPSSDVRIEIEDTSKSENLPKRKRDC